MRKKVLSLTLVAAMMAGCLAGCGNAESKDEGTTAAAGDSTTQAAASEDAIQNLIAATTGTVDLSVWASEEDQDLTTQVIEEFKKKYSDVDFNITLGAESESKAKDDILVDVEAAPDVFAFADDQINELVKAGALQPVQATYTFDVANENVAASVEAASVDGTLYAYPMTADNGYFMFYDSSVFTEDDVQSLDAMIEAAKKANKKIAMNVSDAWYVYSFFQGAGLDLTLNDDGLTNTCTWNQAAVNGTWRAADAAAAWGENYAAAKLPTYTVAGKQVQMASFSGCKLIGVNPHSKNVGWSMLLAEYLTSEDTQVTRFKQRGLGPSNINASESDEVKADPAISALAAQAAYATPQRVGGNYWTPAETLGSILAQGNPDGTDLQKLLDNAVEGIEAPVSQE